MAIFGLMIAIQIIRLTFRIWLNYLHNYIDSLIYT